MRPDGSATDAGVVDHPAQKAPPPISVARVVAFALELCGAGVLLFGGFVGIVRAINERVGTWSILDGWLLVGLFAFVGVVAGLLLRASVFWRFFAAGSVIAAVLAMVAALVAALAVYRATGSTGYAIDGVGLAASAGTALAGAALLIVVSRRLAARSRPR